MFVKLLLCAGPAVGWALTYVSLTGHRDRTGVTLPILQAKMRFRKVKEDLNQSPGDILKTQAQPRGQARAGGRQGHARSLGTPLGLTPALACLGAADKSYQMEATVAVGSAVTG